MNPFKACTEKATFLMEVKIVPKYISEDFIEGIVGEIDVPIEVKVDCDIVYPS